MRASRRIRGFGSVWIVILGIAFVGMLGLAIDMAYVSLCTAQAQNAADATALGGVWGLRESQNNGDSQSTQNQKVFATAQATAQANYVARQQLTINNADIVPGRFYRPGDSTTKLGFYPNAYPYNSVQATIERTSALNGPVALMFGSIFGVPGQSLTSTAIAIIGNRPPGIIILDPTGSGAFTLQGSASINAPDGSIVVNSSSKSAFDVTGNAAQVDAFEIDIVGSYKKAGGTMPPIKTGQSAVPDPLAGLPLPPATGTAGAKNGSVYQPGYYSKALNNQITSSGTLAPGVYVIDDGLSLGNNTLTGNNVIIIMRTGGISMGGNGGLTITPPTTGTYAGISIFQLPTDTSAATLVGTPGTSGGTFYFPAASLTLQGNASAYAQQIIAFQLHLAGNASFTIPAGDRFGYTGNIMLVK